MKNIIIALCAVLSLSACAGVRPMDTNDMQMQKVIELPGKSKNDLYDRSRMWYAASFKKANSVIQYENKENGTIMGNGNLMITELGAWRRLQISIATEVKENKSRITVKGLSLSSAQFSDIGVQKRYWDEFQAQISDMFVNYENYLKEPTIGLKKDDW